MGEEGPNPETASARILLVEDDPTSALVLASKLRGAGYAVDLAKNGLEAIELMADTTFDALIADLNMPKMDGRELCERVRQDPELRDLPILIVTGMDDPRELTWVEDMEPVDLMPKPVRMAELADRLESRLFQGKSGA